MTPERVEWHLGNWAEYMGQRLVPGMHRQSWTEVVSSRDFESLCEDADEIYALACHAAIESLPTIQQKAVYAVYLSMPFWWQSLPLSHWVSLATINIGLILDAKAVI